MMRRWPLFAECAVIAVSYGVRYGWLAAHTHWVTWRHDPPRRSP